MRALDHASAVGSADQPTGLTVGDQVGVAADSRHHAGQGGRHGFEQRVAHSLGDAGQDEDVGRAKVLGGTVDGPDKLNAIGDSAAKPPAR